MRLLGQLFRQTRVMLPRKNYLHSLCFSIAIVFAASSLVTSPASASNYRSIKAISGYAPSVTVNEINVTPISNLSALGTGKRFFSLLPAQDATEFTLVGLTWVGPVAIGTEFKVRVRESGVWSAWFNLEYGEYQGVGNDGSESQDTRVGSDPLLTGLADGIEVAMESFTGVVPSQMKVTLVNSLVTAQDLNLGQESIRMSTAQSDTEFKSATTLVGAVTSPQGALVARPRIVSRAEWGANETWRDPVPRVGNTLLAGIVHHTASTNNYTAAQAPAQMRNLYAYFTKSLNYADMGYNFLVDKYGTIYEGRSGCAIGALNCDSPAVPVQGAHTAGLNINTFGVSAIGNYDVLAPQNPEAMVESIASLMAWKLAPYGLNPNATARILSTDTSGSSKYKAGQTAVTQVITAHRDVGKTVCPGRYLYPYMNEIRARATTLLEPVIQGVKVTPTLVSSADTSPVNVSAIIPSNANWSVDVKNVISGEPVVETSGIQTSSGPISFTWDRKDSDGAFVPIGKYAVSVNASLGGVDLPPAVNIVSIGSLPKAVTQIGFIRSSMTKTKVSWLADSANPVPVTANFYRVSSNGGKSWGAWKKTAKQSFSATWKNGKTYFVQVKSVNALGSSEVTSSRFKVTKFAPPKPSAVEAIKFKRLPQNRVKVYWSPAATEFASSGYYFRVAKNGGSFGKWTKSSGMNTSIIISNWKKNSTYKIQVKVRNVTGYSPTVTSTYTVR